MIELVLHAAGEEAGNVGFEFLAGEVVGVDPHLLGADDGAIQPGQAQAALFVFFRPAPRQRDDRVEEDQFLARRPASLPGSR